LKKIAAVSVLFLILLCSCASGPEPVPAFSVTAGGLEVHFIDVGQGDCILLKNADSSVLIDAGSDEESDKVLSYLRSAGIATLTVAVGTHPHEDHIGSLDEVIDAFSPETVVMPKVSANTKAFENVLDAVSAQNKKIKAAKTGLVLEVGELSLSFLSPPQDSGFDNLNDYSAVISVTYAGKTFLFCGDAERPAEERMLEGGQNVKCDVLKVGHHGSSTSTTGEFLKAAAPQYAVISVGAKNSFGHPAKAVLRRLSDAGAEVYRTDRNGDIVFTVSPEGRLEVRLKKGEQNAA